jgi:hypothetical protein
MGQIRAIALAQPMLRRGTTPHHPNVAPGYEPAGTLLGLCTNSPRPSYCAHRSASRRSIRPKRASSRSSNPVDGRRANGSRGPCPHSQPAAESLPLPSHVAAPDLKSPLHRGSRTSCEGGGGEDTKCCGCSAGISSSASNTAQPKMAVAPGSSRRPVPGASRVRSRSEPEGQTHGSRLHGAARPL